MKASYRIATFFLVLLTLGTCITFQGQTVSDVDGNIYNTVIIGEQLWLKENLSTLHYADGTPVPDVKVYNNSAANAEIYGRLYTWDAAMNGSNQEKAQGICPNGWHIPSEAEWTKLALHIGGFAVAGGKLKEAGTEHWSSPNAGATNSSGFTALPAGEHDTEKFQLLNEYAVLWSSTESSAQGALYYYLAYDDKELHPYDYFKSFYYSVRCLKDETTGIQEMPFQGLLIYPNPFDRLLYFEQKEVISDATIVTTIYNQQGHLVKELTLPSRITKHNLQFLPSGLYYVKIEFENKLEYQKLIKN